MLKNSHHEPILNRSPWISAHSNSDLDSEDSFHVGRKIQRRAPSPPNLFNEFKKYQQIAPDFMKKYPYHVASGGKKIEAEKKKTVGIKRNKPVPKRVPFKV